MPASRRRSRLSSRTRQGAPRRGAVGVCPPLVVAGCPPCLAVRLRLVPCPSSFGAHPTSTPKRHAQTTSAQPCRPSAARASRTCHRMLALTLTPVQRCGRRFVHRGPTGAPVLPHRMVRPLSAHVSCSTGPVRSPGPVGRKQSTSLVLLMTQSCPWHTDWPAPSVDRPSGFVCLPPARGVSICNGDPPSRLPVLGAVSEHS